MILWLILLAVLALLVFFVVLVEIDRWRDMRDRTR